ncbi:MAG: acyl-CoA thioesterase [Gammaproteobacteria bacterium]
MSEQHKLLHTIICPVRWGDMDAIGHVNNTVYFRYFEQVRINWLERIGAADAVSAGETGIVIINAECTYLKPIIYPAKLEVSMSGGRPGRSSFVAYYEIRDAAERDTLFATGSSKIVWVDRVNEKSIPLPAFIRSLLPG